jgi:hypothetical protein
MFVLDAASSSGQLQHCNTFQMSYISNIKGLQLVGAMGRKFDYCYSGLLCEISYFNRQVTVMVVKSAVGKIS